MEASQRSFNGKVSGFVIPSKKEVLFFVEMTEWITSS